MKMKTIFKTIFWILGLLLLLVAAFIISVYTSIKNQSVITKGDPIHDYGASKSALLVIDIQEIATGEISVFPYFREHSEQLLEQINRTIDTFSNRKIPVIYVRSEITNPVINLLNNSYAKGSDGVKNDKRLKVVTSYEVIKGSEDSFRKTNLDDLLINNKINTLYLIGIDAAECVNSTAQAAQNRKYNVNIIREAVMSKSQSGTDSMMTCFKERGINVFSIDSISPAF